MLTSLNSVNFPVIQNKLVWTGTWFAILGCFSIGALGTAVTSAAIFIALALWIISLKCQDYPVIIASFPFAMFGTLLFVYIGLSLLWSNNFSEGLSMWSKYKEFALLPVFVIYFSLDRYRQFAQVALYSGMLVALFFTYLVYFDLFPIESRQHSLSNHIFNGILLSFFAYWSLLLAWGNEKNRLLYLLLFAASVYSIFVIREGRTGYMLTIALILLFAVQTWHWKGLLGAASALAGLIIALVLIYQHSLSAFASVHLHNWQQFFDPDFLARQDIRIEFYINTFRLLADHLWLGVGIGDYASAYQTTSSTHQHYWGPTVNAHNEFLMLGTQTGIAGVSLFVVFLIHLAQAATKLKAEQAKLAAATVVTVVISCLFNSSFMDLNDGTLLMLLIAVFFAHPYQPGNKHTGKC